MQSPDRIVVDIADFKWRAGKIPFMAGSAIKDVRYGSLGGGQGRLVFETNKPVMIKAAFPIEKGQGQPDRLVIDFAPTSAAVMKEVSTQMMGTLGTSNGRGENSIQLPPRKKTGTASVSKSKERKLIIIDPGHGGQDPGARGANGTYEKTIVLAVGLELKRQLENAGYRVEMTRSSDVFIPLRGRVNYARKKGGDLFVSLHADSISRSDVTGASVYTLSDTASDKETEKLAERENKSDLIAGIDLSHQEDDVAGILIDLAARDTMNQSRFLAKTVITNFDQNGVRILDNRFRSAGFAVLKAMDIPSILVEMGYLTNRGEVDRLCTPAYQRKVAESLKLSIDKYFQKNGR
jgi:N-acetylmuramoyl-L-alanine amidase